MAGRFSDAVQNKSLDLKFGSSHDAIMPSTVYFGLSTTKPTNTGGSVTEPSGGGYTRVGVANTDTNFPAASARAKSNGTVITFPQPTGSWGSPQYVPFFSASSGGTYLGYIDLGSGQAIDATSAPPSFAVGALALSGLGT